MKSPFRFLIRGRQTFHAHETARYDELNGFPLAGFRRRAFAFLIDSSLVLFVLTPLAAGYRALDLEHRMTARYGHVTVQAHAPSEHALEVFASLLYFGLLLYWGNGKTPGKWLMKIRVVSLTEERITLWQSMERALGYGASALEGGFGFFQYWMNCNRQTVHDRIAETIVVDDRPRPAGTVVETSEATEPA